MAKVSKKKDNQIEIKPEDIAETVIFLLKARKEITIDEILIRRCESQVI